MPTDPLPAAQAGAPDAVPVRVHGWKARSAALLALIAPLALALLVGIVLANRAAVAVLAAGLAIAASVALWYALIHRGALRAAGAAASAIAATGLIVILATHWHGVLVLAGVLLLLGVFALTSRFALGLASEAAAQTGARPVPRPASAVLIINPRSGGGKARRFDLAAQARRRGINRSFLSPGTSARARRARDRLRGARCSAWPEGTARRRWSRASPPSTASRTCASQLAHATTSPSTSGSTATTSSGRWTRSPTGSSAASTSRA